MWYLPKEGLGFMEIPAGTFFMGARPEDRPPGRFFDVEEPRHGVEITRAYWLKQTEVTLGRIDRGRWGPREIDIDILAYDDVLMVDDVLTLPHPQLDQRRFVLEPLMEIAPDWVHPVLGQTAEAMLRALPA